MSLAPSQKRQISWRIVCQIFGGRLYIHELSLTDTDSGVDAFQKLKQEYRRLKCLPSSHFWDSGLGFYSPFIETAILSTNSTADLEGQCVTRQVFVVERKREIEFTAAFYKPELLSSARTFVTDNARFQIGRADRAVEKEVLVIGLRMNWVGLLFLIMLNLLVCVGVGVIVGMAARDVNLGVAVTSGVAAVVACVQAVLFLVYK